MDSFQRDEILVVSSAEVSGFLEDKSNKGTDFLFIVDVLWSDGRSCCIRRSYKDFLDFRKQLFVYSKQNTVNIDLPSLSESSVLDILKRDKRNLAEEREIHLHKFVKKLIDGNPFIISLPVVVNFFEPRHTDPVPCKYPCDGDNDDNDPFSEELFDRQWIKQKT